MTEEIPTNSQTNPKTDLLWENQALASTASLTIDNTEIQFFRELQANTSPNKQLKTQDLSQTEKQPSDETTSYCFVICKEHQKSHQLKFRIRNPMPQVSYILLSSEPSRKIHHPPRFVTEQNSSPCYYEYIIEENQQLGLFRDKFCVVGLDELLSSVVMVCEVPISHSSFDFCGECLGQNVEMEEEQKNGKIYITRQRISFNTVQCHEDRCKQPNQLFTVQPAPELTAFQVQKVLETMQHTYQTPSLIDLKNNSLTLQFPIPIAGIFQNFYILNSLKSIERTQSITFSYFTVTKHLPSHTYGLKNLIKLPEDTVIKQLTIHYNWVVIGTAFDVVFLHLYRPEEQFLTLKGLKCNCIETLGHKRIALFEYKYMHIYELKTQGTPIFVHKLKIKKMVPHTLALKNNLSLFLAGVNYSKILNEPDQDKKIICYDHFMKQNLKGRQHLDVDSSMTLCTEKSEEPVKNLIYLHKLDLFLCSCGTTVYLFHFANKNVLAQVGLSTTVRKLCELHYPLNMVNVLATQTSKSIRRLTMRTPPQQTNDKQLDPDYEEHDDDTLSKSFPNILQNSIYEQDKLEPSKVQNHDKGLIQIVFESFCNVVGVEICNASYGQDIEDFYISNNMIFVCNATEIRRFTKQDTQGLLITSTEQKDQKFSSQHTSNNDDKTITKIAGNKQQIVCAVKSQHLVEICFMEL